MTHLDRSLTLKRPGAGQHFVKQYARGKNVSTRIHSIAACLLGCGVSRGAVGNADFRDLGMVNSGRARGFFVEEFRESEVEYFDLAGRRHHYVTGFDVAMNDAAGVCCGECLRSLQCNR